MKKAIVLALAVIATVGRRCQRAGQPDRVRRALWPISTATKTITLPFVTPLTGGAGFLGAEQIELGEVRREDARPEPSGSR